MIWREGRAASRGALELNKEARGTYVGRDSNEPYGRFEGFTVVLEGDSLHHAAFADFPRVSYGAKYSQRFAHYLLMGMRGPGEERLEGDISLAWKRGRKIKLTVHVIA